MSAAEIVCVVPVGLPARGKTYMATKLGRYLRWLGIRTCVFSVGAYRRAMAATAPAADTGDTSADLRDRAAEAAFNGMVEFFSSQGGQVGIYDDTMTIQRASRDALLLRLAPLAVQVVFVEAICNVPDVIEATVREVKLGRPEYRGCAPAAAVADYLAHIGRLEPLYEELKDPSESYIKVTNMGIDSDFAEHIVANNVRGFLQTRFLLFLLNLHIAARTIYLLPNAPAADAQCGHQPRFKDDCGLGDTGVTYARQATNALLHLRAGHADAPSTWPKVYTSTRKCSRETAQFVPTARVTHKASLVRLNPGAVDRLTNDEIRAKYPQEYEKLLREPFKYRFPRGESYHNLALRIENVILELEGEKEDVLVIAHESVLRCLYAYLLDRDEKEIPTIEFPPNCIIELAPDFYGSKKESHHFFC